MVRCFFQETAFLRSAVDIEGPGPGAEHGPIWATAGVRRVGACPITNYWLTICALFANYLSTVCQLFDNYLPLFYYLFTIPISVHYSFTIYQLCDKYFKTCPVFLHYSPTISVTICSLFVNYLFDTCPLS